MDDLARQALLACLETAELTKVYQLQSAHEIWARLAEEYGPLSDVRRAQAEGAFYSLQKKDEIPISRLSSRHYSCFITCSKGYTTRYDVFIVLAIGSILIQNLTTTIHPNSVLSASEKDIQSTVV